MRKLFLFLPFLFYSISISAQQKLTLDDLFTKSDLLPKGIKGLQWIKGEDKYAMPDEASGEYLLAYVPNENKADTIIRSTAILPDLKKIPSLTWQDARHFYFTHENKLYLFDLSGKKTTLLYEIPKDAENTDTDPISLHTAYTQSNNLYIVTKEGKKQISFEENPDIISGKSVHRDEFGIYKGTFWSPSGKSLAFYRMDQTMVTDYPILELGSLPAKNKNIKYPMAGQKSHHVTLGVHHLSSNKTLFLNTGKPEEQYLTNISWSSDEQHILIAIVNRAQNEMKMNMYSALTGEFEKTLFTETDPEWVEPLNPASFLADGSNRFIWQSERGGTNQLYLYDLNGKLLKQISAGDFTVTRYLGADRQGKNFFAEVSSNRGLEKQLIRCDLNGKTTMITGEPGNHSIQISDSKKYFLDQFTSLKVPLKISLKNTTDKALKTIQEVRDPIINYDLPKPQLIQLRASDGTPLNARIFKPSNLDTTRKYPVLVYVYGGPHAQLISDRWMGGANLWLSWMAAQGYIVFSLDNRGSANRGQAFEQVIHRRLGTVEAGDQMVGINYLRSLRYADVNRIGIHGWSFGGFMTTTLICKNPGLFKTGVCGGPVIDWKMYEIMYTERYMDTPEENKEGYETANLLNYADNLKDRLLMIHGTADDVVVWQHGQEFVKKCVEKGNLIDYMPYPGHGHNVVGKDRLHLMRTITRYFQEHL